MWPTMRSAMPSVALSQQVCFLLFRLAPMPLKCVCVELAFTSEVRRCLHEDNVIILCHASTGALHTFFRQALHGVSDGIVVAIECQAWIYCCDPCSYADAHNTSLHLCQFAAGCTQQSASQKHHACCAAHCQSAARQNIRIQSCVFHNVNYNVCQPGLGACGASLIPPGRSVLSALIGAETDR